MAAQLRSRLRRTLPVFEWLPGYRRATFTSDLAAGLTVGAVLIPQGMAYALVAGLGFYARLGPARFFFSTHEAVGYAQNLLQDREITLEPEPPVLPAIRMPAGAALDV